MRRKCAWTGVAEVNGSCENKRRTGGESRARAHLATPTIAEVSCSLSLRGTSGKRAERGSFHELSRSFESPLPNPLSPRQRSGERESPAGLLVVSRGESRALHTFRRALHP